MSVEESIVPACTRRLLMFQIVTIETGGLFNLAVDLMQLFSENTTYVGWMDHILHLPSLEQALMIWITSYTSLSLSIFPLSLLPSLLPPFPPSFPSPPTLVTFLHYWMLLDCSFKSEMITLTSSLKRYDLFKNHKYRIKFSYSLMMS